MSYEGVVDSIMDIIPVEYHNLLDKIDIVHLESFKHSLTITEDTDTHKYLNLIHALKRTIHLFDKPSAELYSLYGRLCFVSAQYEELIEMHETYPDNQYIIPFVARIFTYQNEFSEAMDLLMKTLENVGVESDTKMVDIITYVEAYFSLGLIQVYSRMFDKLEITIGKLKAITSNWRVKRIMGDSHHLNYVFYENILTVIRGLVTGQPKAMRDELVMMERWIDNVNDPWLKGYYFNLYGISHFMNQEISLGEEKLKMAYSYFDSVHDLRGFTTVGANLGTSMLTQGVRVEGREYIEATLKPMIKLKNYSLAISNMLQVSKSYLDENSIDDARSMVSWAEELASSTKITEPATFSYFSYFYSRVGDEAKAINYLNKLESLAKVDSDGESDVYTRLWYYNAAAVNSMGLGDLYHAFNHIHKGIEIAEKNSNLDLTVEFSMIQLEIVLKKFTIDRNIATVYSAITVLSDLHSLIEKMDNLFYISIFRIINVYLYFATENQMQIITHIDEIEDMISDMENTEQYKEFALLKDRYNFLYGTAKSEMAPLLNTWLGGTYLQVFFVLEAMRLLNSLQFVQTNIQSSDEEISPIMLFIVSEGGVTSYSYTFKDAQIEIDEVLVGGFLSAVSSFSSELFGGGMLSKIDQENFVLLIEKLYDKYLCVLIVSEETYQIRKKYRKFIDEASKTDISDYLSIDFVLDDNNPVGIILENLIVESFSINRDSDGEEEIDIERVDPDHEEEIEDISVVGDADEGVTDEIGDIPVAGNPNEDVSNEIDVANINDEEPEDNLE